MMSRDPCSGANSARAASRLIVPSTRSSRASARLRNTALPRSPVAPSTRIFTALSIRNTWSRDLFVDVVEQLVALLEARIVDQHRAVNTFEHEQATRRRANHTAMADKLFDM